MIMGALYWQREIKLIRLTGCIELQSICDSVLVHEYM